MKRFFRFVFRLLLFAALFAALILLGVLFTEMQTLSTQVAALSTRVHVLVQANTVSVAPGRDAQTGGSQGVAPSRTPTRTPRPTNTPTSTRTSTPTRTPTATATPSDPYFIVNSAWVNVRTGPGNNYPIINAVPQGDRYDIIARNRSSSLNTTWIEFCCVDGQQVWIYAGLVDLSVDWSTIPISGNIPPPPTFTPTPTPTQNRGNGGGGNDGMKGLPPIREGPEYRCSPYESELYRYSQSVEPRIVNQQRGLIYGPYTGTYFSSIRETDIEHIVARSEAHDSGLCAADSNTRRAFANDLNNLTLASPRVNRHEKVDKDLAQWLPALNRCWYVAQVVKVKDKYNLTMDQAEAAVARRVIASCDSFEMIYTDRGSAPQQQQAQPAPQQPAQDSDGTDCNSNPLGCYDDNNNGRITCAEAERHGIAPVPRGHPAYQYMRDGDGDGVVCE